jgi:aspartyl-tRNA(Asn)/glutamyl-tRNA(Gln) amidotransferase subunit A
MDTFGPLCGSAEDCGLVLEVIAGGDSMDPSSAGKSFYFVPQYARALSDLTVGCVAPEFEPRLRECGVKVQTAAMPDFPFDAIAATIVNAEAAAAGEEGPASDQVDRRSGLEIRAADYLRAQRIRTLVKHEFRQLFTTVDVVALASSADPAGALAGLPALRLPGAGSADLQLMGPAFSENTLLAVGKALQERQR